DHKPERMQRAVELYRQGYAPVIIISAGTILLEGEELMPEAELMRRQALALGLDQDVMMKEDHSLSTIENAQYTRDICHEQGIGSILLVTSAHHSRRAKRIFEDTLGRQIDISVQPALYGSDTLSWWFSLDRIAVALYEYKGWIGYWWSRAILGQFD
ncbi:MAG: YdcF family protein, partial [Anaerolineae bacterium]|nr:YdcF family protein [Anaerolineae bacterium]